MNEQAYYHQRTIRTREDGSRYTCGATGYILYEGGRAWSVNLGQDGRVLDYRYALNEWPSNPIDCPECVKHIAAAADSSDVDCVQNKGERR